MPTKSFISYHSRFSRPCIQQVLGSSLVWGLVAVMISNHQHTFHNKIIDGAWVVHKKCLADAQVCFPVTVVAPY